MSPPVVKPNGELSDPSASVASSFPLLSAGHKRRSRGGSAATCFPKDLQLAIKRCGLDESTDTAAQDDQPQDERLIAQSKTHDDTNRSRTQRRRKNMIPTRGAGYSFTRSSNRDKRLKINATGSSISVVMPELPVARSDSPGPKSNVEEHSVVIKPSAWRECAQNIWWYFLPVISLRAIVLMIIDNNGRVLCGAFVDIGRRACIWMLNSFSG
ncbi:hypothetical protein FOVG_17297 [Fusarium oxysporum f. sp. pisi HDV247]|uniref:Uncharacterized protein n=1 Tax=Fusarium oxysporum f. sp. pisi HDV247 TaxID=1080344 RepID=W9NFF2_FUSOX|nr:hypothetical protein FOVG_17297 [Fusarium oxysporum f. sp. pisi HDV247]